MQCACPRRPRTCPYPPQAHHSCSPGCPHPHPIATLDLSLPPGTVTQPFLLTAQPCHLSRLRRSDKVLGKVPKVASSAAMQGQVPAPRARAGEGGEDRWQKEGEAHRERGPTVEGQTLTQSFPSCDRSPALSIYSVFLFPVRRQRSEMPGAYSRSPSSTAAVLILF